MVFCYGHSSKWGPPNFLVSHTNLPQKPSDLTSAIIDWFLFSKNLYKWNHSVFMYPFLVWLLPLHVMILKCCRVYRSFLFIMSSILWIGCTTIYSSIHLLMNNWVFPVWGYSRWSCYEHSCPSLHMDIYFHFLWVNYLGVAGSYNRYMFIYF